MTSCAVEGDSSSPSDDEGSDASSEPDDDDVDVLDKLIIQAAENL